MFGTERFKADASAEKVNHGVQLKETPLSSSHRGSILIGIIITMVVMAFLGAGMLSLTTTSTFHELLFGNNAGASSVAESGGRYTLAVIRDAYATDMTKLNAINANQTFTMSNGSSFQITNWVQNVTTNPDTVTFTSVGTVSSGFLQAKRQIKYGIQPANQSGVPPPPPLNVIDLSTLPGAVHGGEMGFAAATVGGDQALNVTKDQGGGASTEAYVLPPQATSNPLWVNWGSSGNYSSYDLQVKIATGDLVSGSLVNPPARYSNGLAFRALEVNPSQNQFSFFGVSIMRSTIVADTGFADGIANGMVPPITPPSGATNWANNKDYTLSPVTIRESDGTYYQCKADHESSNSNKPPNNTYWTDITNNDKPMIVLWRRDGNSGNGDDKWLAYKLLDQTGGDIIVDSAGYIKPWSTILVRVIEAASVKLTVSSAPLINIGDIITGAGGTGTAKVFRKINDNGGNVVLLLNNVVGTFTRPGTIGTYSTEATWGYRVRDNYIWVFYGDTDAHSSDATPLNNVRLANPRGNLNWPIADVSAWTATEDKFTLVQWNASLNTTLASDYTASVPSLYIMGSGNEAGAIIRTDMWTRPGPYAASGDFPNEVGLASLGDTSKKTYFDDLAYYLLGGSSAAYGSGLVIQYP